MANSTSTKRTERRPASLDDNLQIHFGPDVCSVEIGDFIDKRLAQLQGSLAMMQSDAYLALDGGGACSRQTRERALWAVIDSVTQITGAFSEFARVSRKEATS